MHKNGQSYINILPLINSFMKKIIELIFADDFCHSHVKRLSDGMKYSSIT